MSGKLRKKERSSEGGVSNFSLVRKGAKFWNSLPWKPVDMSKSRLGEFDDAVFFGLEELDGNAFLEFKKKQEEATAAGAAEADGEAAEEVVEEAVQKKENKKMKRKREDADLEVQEEVTVEEVEDDVKPAKKTKKDKKKKEPVVEANAPSDSEENRPEKSRSKPEKSKKAAKQAVVPVALDATPFDLESAGDWGGLAMNGLLCDSLRALDFVKPTPIQQSAIPKILENRIDVVGVAETGSGKTLAFGIPILNFLLENWELYRQSFSPAALIISPTRELAMQTTTVLTDICKPWKTKAKRPDLRININIAAVVGGMSEHKQKRLLNTVLHIIVATPGRLCEVMEDDSLSAFQDMSRLKFLVVDEADRIMEEGHFAELNRVFSRIRDHESIAEKGEDVRVVMWRRNKGIPEAATGGVEDEDNEDVLEMGVNDFEANLGPTADDVDRMIAELKARGETVDRPYDSDNDDDDADDAPVDEEAVDDNDDDEDEQDVDEEDEDIEGADSDEEDAVGDEEDADADEDMDVDEENEAEGEDGPGEEEGEDAVYEEDGDFADDTNESFTPHDVPDFPPLPALPPFQRQTLLFSATGLAARANLHRTELAQLKKLRLKGTIVGVASDFLLPLSLKKLFAEVGIQKRIDVVDATRAAASAADDAKTKKSKKDAAGADDVDVAAAAAAMGAEKSAVSVLPKQLAQFEIRVPAEDKDIYLYYYLVQHPGRRVIIFVNSIKTCRRVDGLLRAMGLPCKPLHAELPQRTRLQNLDFLKSQPQAILVATDVAARGVDVDRIATVIHYDVARSPQVYIHRSGRTARNGQSGEALSLVSPDDLKAHHVITKYLFSYQRSAPEAATSSSSSSKSKTAINEKSLPSFTVQMLIIPALKERVLLARKIFSLSAQQSRASKEAHWAHQQAKDAGLLVEGDDMEPDYAIERGEFADVSDDAVETPSDDVDDGTKKPLSKQAKRELAILKQELTTLLERPLGSLAGTMRSSTGLLLQHQQYQPSSVLSGNNNAVGVRKHGKKARKAKANATAMMAANDWRKRKNGFFVYAR